jgi:hypothetical protein
MPETPRPNPADPSADPQGDASDRPRQADGRDSGPISANRRAFFRQILGLGVEQAEKITRRVDQVLENYAYPEQSPSGSQDDSTDRNDDPDTAAEPSPDDYPLKLDSPPNTEPRR